MKCVFDSKKKANFFEFEVVMMTEAHTHHTLWEWGKEDTNEAVTLQTLPCLRRGRRRTSRSSGVKMTAPTTNRAPTVMRYTIPIIPVDLGR